MARTTVYGAYIQEFAPKKGGVMEAKLIASTKVRSYAESNTCMGVRVTVRIEDFDPKQGAVGGIWKAMVN